MLSRCDAKWQEITVGIGVWEKDTTCNNQVTMNPSWNSRLSDCLFLNLPTDSLDIAFWLILRQKDPNHFCIVTGVFRFYPARWISGTFKAIWTLAKKTRLWCSPSWPSNSKSMTNHGCWILLNHAHTTMKMVEVSLVTTRLLYFCCLGKRVAFGRIQIFLAKRYRKTSGNSIYHHSSSLLEVVWSDSSRGPRSKASWHVAHEGFFDQTTGPSSLPTSFTCIPWLLKGTHLNHISSTPKMWCYPSGSFLWSSKQTARRLSLRHSNDCFRMFLIT